MEAATPPLVPAAEEVSAEDMELCGVGLEMAKYLGTSPNSDPSKGVMIESIFAGGTAHQHGGFTVGDEILSVTL